MMVTKSSFQILVLFKKSFLTWLVWLSGLSISLRTKGSSVRFPVQGTCLLCRPGPQQGACNRQPHVDVSLPLSLPSPLKINKIFKKSHSHQNTNFLFFTVKLWNCVLYFSIQSFVKKTIQVCLGKKLSMWFYIILRTKIKLKSTKI